MINKLRDKHFWVQAYLSGFWSLFSTVYISAVTFLTVPAGNIRVVDTIVGFLLGTIVSTVIQYWLGSSLGSKTKDKVEEDQPKE
jgi:uncharacterized membrane protein YdjX (TVP38/TMEM64 family)